MLSSESYWVFGALFRLLHLSRAVALPLSRGYLKAENTDEQHFSPSLLFPSSLPFQEDRRGQPGGARGTMSLRGQEEDRKRRTKRKGSHVCPPFPSWGHTWHLDTCPSIGVHVPHVTRAGVVAEIGKLRSCENRSFRPGRRENLLAVSTKQLHRRVNYSSYPYFLL